MSYNVYVRSRDGVRLHTSCHGESHRPALVLVHGYPDNAQVWTPLIAELLSDFYIIAYDVRGAGQSDTPRRWRDYRLARLAEDLQCVVDELLPGRSFHLAAHDWGSIQSWESVTGEILAQRLLSFTSISGPCLDHASFWLRRQLTRQPRQVLDQLLHSWYIFLFHAPGLAEGVWHLLLAPLWPRVRQMSDGIIDAPSQQQLHDALHGIALYRANFISRLLRPRRRRATCPVQVILPHSDAFVRPQLVDGLQRWVAELYVRDVQGGHWIIHAQPRLIAAMIRDFALGIDAGQLKAELLTARVH